MEAESQNDDHQQQDDRGRDGLEQTEMDVRTGEAARGEGCGTGCEICVTRESRGSRKGALGQDGRGIHTRDTNFLKNTCAFREVLGEDCLG